jgi:hypothetical protein
MNESWMLKIFVTAAILVRDFALVLMRKVHRAILVSKKRPMYLVRKRPILYK